MMRFKFIIGSCMKQTTWFTKGLRQIVGVVGIGGGGEKKQTTWFTKGLRLFSLGKRFIDICSKQTTWFTKGLRPMQSRNVPAPRAEWNKRPDLRRDCDASIAAAFILSERKQTTWFTKGLRRSTHCRFSARHPEPWNKRPDLRRDCDTHARMYLSGSCLRNKRPDLRRDCDSFPSHRIFCRLSGNKRPDLRRDCDTLVCTFAASAGMRNKRPDLRRDCDTNELDTRYEDKLRTEKQTTWFTKGLRHAGTWY